MMPERLTCCVCGGAHHSMQCAVAQKFMRQCLELTISPPPPGPPIRVTETVPSREEPAQHAARVAQRAYHHRWIMERPRY